jgi:hypothetical protein
MNNERYIRLCEHSNGPHRDTPRPYDESHGERMRPTGMLVPDLEQRLIQIRMEYAGGDKDGVPFKMVMSLEDANKMAFWIREWIECSRPEILEAHMGGANAFGDYKPGLDQEILEAERARWNKSLNEKPDCD